MRALLIIWKRTRTFVEPEQGAGGQPLQQRELCVWTLTICLWASGVTQRLLPSSIATRTVLSLRDIALRPFSRDRVSPQKIGESTAIDTTILFCPSRSDLFIQRDGLDLPDHALSRARDTGTYALVSPEVATQSILLGFYAFGAMGVVAAPVTVALTNGLVKIYRDSVVFSLRCA